MPRNIPPTPDYSGYGSGAESSVWEALQAPPDNAVVISQYRVPDNRRVLREADFVVLIPDVGVGVVEVKGGLVWTIDGSGSPGTAGVWTTRSRTRCGRRRRPASRSATSSSARVRWPSAATRGGSSSYHVAARFRPADSERKEWIDGLNDLAARLSAAIYTGDPGRG